MIFADDSFAGHHIVVTGASSGLGRQTALRLAQAGARLTLVARDTGRLTETLGLLSKGEHATIAMDLADAEAVSDALAAVAKERGLLNGVFHSAGSAMILPTRITKNRHLDELFGAGFRGAFGVVKAISRKHVMQDGGSVVIMSSISSKRGRPGMAAYSAAKAAVDGLVRAAATELADRRIRLNSIVAGAIATAMHDDFVNSVSEDMVANYCDLHLLGFGEPDDVAFAAMFLLSDASRWITGTNLVVDGGYSAK